MYADGVIKMPSIFPVPHFNFGKIALLGHKNPKCAFHIFNGTVIILLFFKPKFLQLIFIKQNGMHFLLGIPELLYAFFSRARCSSRVISITVPSLTWPSSSTLIIFPGFSSLTLIILFEFDIRI